MEEFWKDLPEFDGQYQSSTSGRTKSLERVSLQGHLLPERILKPCKRPNGYLCVGLYKDGKVKYFSVHRLVAMAFIPNPDNLPEVNHKNEVKDDNRVENLEWCTRKHNVNYGTGIQRRVEKQSKPVLQFTREGEFVREWPSAKECGRSGFSQGAVSSCCRGERKQAYGYIWRYK